MGPYKAGTFVCLELDGLIKSFAGTPKIDRQTIKRWYTRECLANRNTDWLSCALSYAGQSILLIKTG